jgi:hypothetical protein
MPAAQRGYNHPMTPDDCKKLQLYEAALHEIAAWIEDERALAAFQQSHYSQESRDSGRAHIYKQIVRIVEDVLKPHAADPPAVASPFVSRRVH